MTLPIIETPKYSVVIPSTGEQVVYRPYLVKEEKVLMIALESEDQDQILRAVKEIIHACTFGKIKVEELALFDLEYVFLKLRSKSVGEISSIGLKCSNCGTSNKIDINLDQIEFDKIDRSSFSIMLTDKVGVTLRYPSVDDATKLAKYTGVEAVMKTIVACIVNIYDDDKVYPAKDSTPKELEQFLETLNSEQFKKIQTFFESMPSLSHTAKFTCESCETENEVLLKGMANFFG
jgi:hypothetical protein